MDIKKEKAQAIKLLAEQLNDAIKEAGKEGLTITINGSTGYQKLEIHIEERISY